MEQTNKKYRSQANNINSNSISSNTITTGATASTTTNTATSTSNIKELQDTELEESNPDLYTAASQWAEECIDNQQKQHALEHTILSMYSTTDSITEEYYKSQVVSQEQKQHKLYKETELHGYVREEEMLIEESQQECEDILQSTQFTMENIHEYTTATPSFNACLLYTSPSPRDS